MQGRRSVRDGGLVAAGIRLPESRSLPRRHIMTNTVSARLDRYPEASPPTQIDMVRLVKSWVGRESLGRAVVRATRPIWQTPHCDPTDDTLARKMRAIGNPSIE